MVHPLHSQPQSACLPFSPSLSNSIALSFCERLLLRMRYLANIDYISFASLLLFLGCSHVLEYMVNKIQFLNLNVIPVPLCYRAPSTFTSSLFVFLSLHLFLTLLLSLFCERLLLRMRYLANIDCISFARFDIPTALAIKERQRQTRVLTDKTFFEN